MTLLNPLKRAARSLLPKWQPGDTEATLGKTLRSATHSSTRPRNIDEHISKPQPFSSPQHGMPEWLGSGAYGTGERCFLRLENVVQIPLEGESSAARLEREMSALAAFQVIKKTIRNPYSILGTEEINTEFLILNKLNHPNVIHGLNGKAGQNVVLMTDGGTALGTIQARSDYKQLQHFLKKIKINSKNYSLQRPLTNHYQSIINVYQEMTTTHDAKKISLEDLISTCKKKLPNVDMNAVKARFESLTREKTKPLLMGEFLHHLQLHAEMTRHNPETILEWYLGKQGSAELGMCFTLQDYLEKAKSTGFYRNFELDFDLLGLFSHFTSKTSNLAKDVFKHCKRTYNPVDYLKKFTNKHKNKKNKKHVNKYKLTIKELQRSGMKPVPYFTPGESLAIFYQVCCGVAYLHENDIAHNDLHTDNIVINQRGEVRIIDFGCSWDGSRQDHRANLENAVAEDRARLGKMFCGILEDHAGELAKTPDGKARLLELTALPTKCTTAKQWRDALESFRHLFPNWDCLQPEPLKQA